MSLVRRYTYVDRILSKGVLRVVSIEENCVDALIDEQYLDDIPVIRLVDLIKYLDYTISEKEIWNLIANEENASEYMFLLDPATNQAYHINTSGNLREVANIVLDDEGYYVFLEKLVCEKSAATSIGLFSECKGMGISVKIHGKDHAF